jgi:hypothetical protein
MIGCPWERSVAGTRVGESLREVCVRTTIGDLDLLRRECECVLCGDRERLRSVRTIIGDLERRDAVCKTTGDRERLLREVRTIIGECERERE